MSDMNRLSTALALILISACVMAQDISITAGQLPKTAIELIDEAFPDDSIKSVKIEKRASLVQYEVRLTGKVKLQFSKDGKFTQCECTGKRAIPSVLVPDRIAEYVEKGFKDHRIMNLEHDSKLWEVVLDNGVELDFNESFRLVDVDSNED